MMDRSKTLQSKREKFIPECLSHLTGVITAHASGSKVTGTDGKIYLDFGAGIAVVNSGHCHPKVSEAIKNQADKLVHSCFHITMNEPYIELAEKLINIFPGKSEKKVMFLNSGAEAVENAIKFARLFTGKKAFIAAEHGFHGRTYGALAMTSKAKPLKEGLDPFMPEVFRMPFAYCYRCPVNKSPESCNTECANSLDTIFKTHVSPENVAGIIVEPIVGEGGIIIPPKEYLQKLRDICDKHNILLIFDEIQTGFGRTGKMFAQEHFDIEPDITLLAKGIANGLPLSAVVGKSEIMDRPQKGAVGSTFGGNPIACSAASAVIDIMRDEDLCKKSEKSGKTILIELESLKNEYDFIGDVRGIGLMIGIEFVDYQNKFPNKVLAQKFIKNCLEKGLIVVSGGVNGNVARILPPLNTPDDEINDGINIIKAVISDLKI